MLQSGLISKVQPNPPSIYPQLFPDLAAQKCWIIRMLQMLTEFWRDCFGSGDACESLKWIATFTEWEWCRVVKHGLDQRDKPLSLCSGDSVQCVSKTNSWTQTPSPRGQVENQQSQVEFVRQRFAFQLSQTPWRWKGLCQDCSVWVTSPSSSTASAPSSCSSPASSVFPWRSANASRFSQKSEQTFTVLKINYFDFHK